MRRSSTRNLGFYGNWGQGRRISIIKYGFAWIVFLASLGLCFLLCFYIVLGLILWVCMYCSGMGLLHLFCVGHAKGVLLGWISYLSYCWFGWVVFVCGVWVGAYRWRWDWSLII